MYLIVRRHDGPMTFLCEERFGPLSARVELDEVAYTFRNNFWDWCFEEGVEGIRRFYSHIDAAERRRQ